MWCSPLGWITWDVDVHAVGEVLGLPRCRTSAELAEEFYLALASFFVGGGGVGGAARFSKLIGRRKPVRKLFCNVKCGARGFRHQVPDFQSKCHYEKSSVSLRAVAGPKRPKSVVQAVGVKYELQRNFSFVLEANVSFALPVFGGGRLTLKGSHELGVTLSASTVLVQLGEGGGEGWP